MQKVGRSCLLEHTRPKNLSDESADITRNETAGIINTYPVIRLEVVDLLPKDKHPEILTEELDHVQCIREARPVFREPGRRHVSSCCGTW